MGASNSSEARLPKKATKAEVSRVRKEIYNDTTNLFWELYTLVSIVRGPGPSSPSIQDKITATKAKFTPLLLGELNAFYAKFDRDLTLEVDLIDLQYIYMDTVSMNESMEELDEFVLRITGSKTRMGFRELHSSLCFMFDN